ncbi:phage tail termination protein [Rouxiella sp. Mn2063]|uniref:phage tail termination protein n=1 Tax=Rouxiella sp. Mn2063 TaxID=3395262 RepID=UPI003BBED738
MTPAMYLRVRDLMISSGLTAGFIVQRLLWTDTGKLTDGFIVFRPSGGSAIRNDLGSDYYVTVDVIGAKGDNTAAEDAAQRIIDFIQSNPIPNDCIGHIENMGGIPAPVLTTEGRLVFRLQFACLYGE